MKHPFEYHTPSPVQIEQIQTVREGCKTLHATLLALPNCRERSLAITKLEEVSMWANKGIVMVDEGPVSVPSIGADTAGQPDPTGPGTPNPLGDAPYAPWGDGYVVVQDPLEATHVYAPTIGVQTKDKPYPRSIYLRWLKAVA